MEIIICYIIIYLIEAFILWHYCSNMFYSKHTKFIECLIIAPLYLSMVPLVLHGNIFFNIFSFLIINFIYIFLLFETKWSSSLFHASITTCIMTISESIIAGIFSNLAYNFYDNNTILQKTVIWGAFSKLLYFLFLQIIIHIWGKSKEKAIVCSRTIGFLITIPVSTAVIITTFFILFINVKLPPFVEHMIAINSLLLLIINILVFSIYRHILQKESAYLELQLQLQRENDSVEYYKMLLQENEAQSILIHDIKKHLQSISLLNEQNEQKKIADYIDCIINSSSLQHSVRVCDHELLNAILCRYQRNCSEKSVSLRTDIRSGCADFMSDNDLTILFCNLLDNGLEAASLLPDSFIELNVGRKSGSSLIVLTMINSCRVNPFTPSGRLVTTKQNSKMHGFGLKSIKRIVEKYHGEMKLYYEEETHTFHTIIVFRCS